MNEPSTLELVVALVAVLFAGALLIGGLVALIKLGPPPPRMPIPPWMMQRRANDDDPSDVP